MVVRGKKTKIVLDADVIIHFAKGGKLEMLPRILHRHGLGGQERPTCGAAPAPPLHRDLSAQAFRTTVRWADHVGLDFFRPFCIKTKGAK